MTFSFVILNSHKRKTSHAHETTQKRINDVYVIPRPSKAKLPSWLIQIGGSSPSWISVCMNLARQKFLTDAGIDYLVSQKSIEARWHTMLNQKMGKGKKIYKYRKKEKLGNIAHTCEKFTSPRVLCDKDLNKIHCWRKNPIVIIAEFVVGGSDRKGNGHQIVNILSRSVGLGQKGEANVL